MACGSYRSTRPPEQRPRCSNSRCKQQQLERQQQEQSQQAIDDAARSVTGDESFDRFLLRMATLRNPETGQTYTARPTVQIVQDCAFVLREAREMGLLADLAPTFMFRRGDYGRR